jgi:serine/threonine protein phosphatase 1
LNSINTEITMRRFAISDIHGCLRTFQVLLDEISFSKNDELYLLGDFTDRGPNSKGVLDYILDLRELGYTVYALRGNHDQMMLDAHHDDESFRNWLGNGGKETLKSFGVNHVREIPERYIEFLMELPWYLEVDRYILVHAGLDFRFINPFDSPDAMLWARKWYDSINYKWLGDRIILHGHTPLFRNEIELQHRNLERQRYLGLDNGCVYTDKQYRSMGLGALCAFNLGDRTLTFVENAEVGQEPVSGPRSRLAQLLSLFSF